VLALEKSASTEASASTEPKQEVVVTEQTTVVAEPVAVVTEPRSTTVIAEPIAVERTVTVAPVQTARAPSPTMTSLYVSSWPQGSYDSEYGKPMARQAAWLEARDNQRQVMMASLGQGFPDGSINSEFPARLHPAQVAYFERAEQQRLARSQPQAVARAEPVTPSSTESSAQAGSAEIAMADTSGIR
jgi:hypothetical protein